MASNRTFTEPGAAEGMEIPQIPREDFGGPAGKVITMTVPSFPIVLSLKVQQTNSATICATCRLAFPTILRTTCLFEASTYRSISPHGFSQSVRRSWIIKNVALSWFGMSWHVLTQKIPRMVSKPFLGPCSFGHKEFHHRLARQRGG